jgi:iron complex outermembrane receptor protein
MRPTRLSLSLFSVSALTCAALAGAQTESTQRASIPEEVVVTARKLGAERLQDVPATISALSEQTLKDMSVSDFEDFAYQIPGLTFLDTGPGERRYTVRGIQSAGQEQVAVYFDETPLTGVQSSTSDSGSQMPDIKLYDLERVEVLRGPQGTTFGANSQSGTVRFITKKPVMNAFESYANGQGSKTSQSNAHNWNVNAVVNLPLVTDKLAVRVLAYDGSDGGYVDNVRLNLRDINSVETTGVRANLRWIPSDTVTLDLQALYQERDLGGDNRYHPFDTYQQRPGIDNGDRDQVAPFTFFETGEFRVGDYSQTFKPDEQRLFSATLDWKLPWANLTAAASHYERDFGAKFDSTWIITFLFDTIDPTLFTRRSDLLFALTDQQQDIEQNAFEVRLSSNGSGNLQWVTGAFWRERESNFRSFVPLVNERGLTFDPGTPFTIPPTSNPGAGIPGCHPCVFAREADKNIEERAVFADAAWKFLPQWELGLGLRYFEVDQKEFGVRLFEFAAFAPNPPTAPPNQVDIQDDEFITKVTLGWKPTSDVTVYALRSEGFRLGGTNNQGIVAVPALFEADELTNYEIGLKTGWGDGRLTWNTSLFHMDWDNIQVAGQDPTGAFGFIGNAGAAEVNGVETEIFWRPTRSWDVSAGLTYLAKRELTEDQISNEVVAPGRAGDLIARIPELTANLALQYNYDLGAGGWTGRWRIEGTHKGDSHTELRPDSPNDRLQEEYQIFNTRFGFFNEELDLDLVLFAENMFDERGDVFIGVGNGEPTFKITNRPRTIGVEFTKGFGR